MVILMLCIKCKLNLIYFYFYFFFFFFFVVDLSFVFSHFVNLAYKHMTVKNEIPDIAQV